MRRRFQNQISSGVLIDAPFRMASQLSNLGQTINQRKRKHLHLSLNYYYYTYYESYY